MITYYLPVTTSHFSDKEQLLLSLISDNRRLEIERLKFTDSKLLSLYSELLVRYLLSKLTKEPFSDFVFDRTEKGKPYVIGHDDIDFNISHTKGMILCSVTDKGRVGVDVERIRHIKYNIMKRCFNLEEISYVEQLPLTDRKFFEIWTKKEAYTKYLGTGLTIDITTINMLSKEHSDKLYSFGSEDYIFSIYCDDNKKVSPVCISEDELINSIKK
jgi:4'-phosphopantetheinyl transferase